jgi:hypothetical protein
MGSTPWLDHQPRRHRPVPARRRAVTANLINIATFITGLVVWDLVGHLPLPLGVAGHEGSTVIIGLNGLRLLRRGVAQQPPATAYQRCGARAGIPRLT